MDARVNANREFFLARNFFKAIEAAGQAISRYLPRTYGNRRAGQFVRLMSPSAHYDALGARLRHSRPQQFIELRPNCESTESHEQNYIEMHDTRPSQPWQLGISMRPMPDCR